MPEALLTKEPVAEAIGVKTYSHAKRRQDSSWFARWTYTYVNPILAKGQKERLIEDDCPPVE
jgi:hypothetical protein